MRAVIVVPSIVLAATLLVAGCAADAGPTSTASSAASPSSAANPGATGPSASAGTSAAPAGAPDGGTTGGTFSATDVAWLQLTVAMSERLQPVLDLVPDRTTDPAWRRLAARVDDACGADLVRSRRLLAESGAPETNPHEGHDMPGMVTAEELTTLRDTTGPRFHRLVAAHLRAHLTQAVRIARAEQQAGANPATKALAATVVRDGTAELARLDQLDRPPGTTSAR
ncbi:DUF305 domain-containing protein [Micromonospora sp. WMMD812]|uniref:DUF305 domain-containing protein n=1 Tax=Micromonospora sp. WMMD812 TaxID=3015152 RepID=UPI00248BD6E9|nr:DUF305 domain-containing protein [Micromonospora sp. WMMD812]WBB69446.1 DUF305 domain-containing protein [Micromonospora sp. WMMD812]